MSTGRNFAEILRLLDSCQLTAENQLATPANWEQGGEATIGRRGQGSGELDNAVWGRRESIWGADARTGRYTVWMSVG